MTMGHLIKTQTTLQENTGKYVNHGATSLSHDQIAVFLVIVEKVYWSTCLEHGLHKPQIQINILKKVVQSQSWSNMTMTMSLRFSKLLLKCSIKTKSNTIFSGQQRTRSLRRDATAQTWIGGIPSLGRCRCHPRSLRSHACIVRNIGPRNAYGAGQDFHGSICNGNACDLKARGISPVKLPLFFGILAHLRFKKVQLW